MCVNTLIMFH